MFLTKSCSPVQEFFVFNFFKCMFHVEQVSKLFWLGFSVLCFHVSGCVPQFEAGAYKTIHFNCNTNSTTNAQKWASVRLNFGGRGSINPNSCLQYCLEATDELLTLVLLWSFFVIPGSSSSPLFWTQLTWLWSSSPSSLTWSLLPCLQSLVKKRKLIKQRMQGTW